MEEIVVEFINESLESLESFDESVFAMENGGEDAAVHVDSLFRAIHTIKGTCGFLGFRNLESLSHAGESLLADLREGRRPVETSVVNALLELSATVRRILDQIQESGRDTDDDMGAIVQTLQELQDERATPDSIIAETTKNSAAQPERTTSNLAEKSIRVHVETLDEIMNLVGELVLTRNRLLQMTSLPANGEEHDALHRLSVLTSELQERVMHTRMQPVRGLWRSMRRIVRDLAESCGKNVELILEGEGTELDKSLLEAVKDPLTHLVRNAIDHGIESAEEREANGKPPGGQLILRAYHQGGLVNLEICDDGAGIDTITLRRRAVEEGRLRDDEATAMDELRALQLIFLPGMSTARELTQLSGRGVGMDVVKTNIERLGGTVSIESAPRVGTTISIQIPLTLAIIPAQIVGVGGRPFAIPQVNIVEILSLRETDVLETVHESRVFRRNGKLIPCLDLRQVLALGGDGSIDPLRTNLVLLQAGAQLVAVVVDRIHDTQEIVVKALPAELRDLPTFAGATILGDGSISLILDVLHLARRCRVMEEMRGDLGLRVRNVASVIELPNETHLLLRTYDRGLKALAMPHVVRVERFKAARVEWTGFGPVLAMQDGLLGLRDLEDLQPARWIQGLKEDDELHAIVFDAAERRIGLCFLGEVDIIHDFLDVDSGTAHRFCLGSAPISEGIVDLIDDAAIVREMSHRPEPEAAYA
jgi:two-component system chemotaxis sensor kinase CheA